MSYHKECFGNLVFRQVLRSTANALDTDHITLISISTGKLFFRPFYGTCNSTVGDNER